MSEQALDLQEVPADRLAALEPRRHRRVLVGMVAGAAFAVLNPPMLDEQGAGRAAAHATHYIGDPGRDRGAATRCWRALHSIEPPMSLQTLRGRVQVSSLTSDLISISAQGKTAAQAEGIANAVAAQLHRLRQLAGQPRRPGARRRCWSPRRPPRGRRCSFVCSSTARSGLLAGAAGRSGRGACARAAATGGCESATR